MIALIVVVVMVNLTMIYLAITTSPGLVVKDYYERGEHYGATLEKEAQEKHLGWTVELTPPSPIRLGHPQPWLIAATDRYGLPLRADSAVLYAYRPSDARADFSVPLEQVTAGQYRGEPLFRLKGVWDLIISVRKGVNRYRLTRRIWVEEAQETR